MPGFANKSLKLTETAEGLSLDDPIDECQARIVVGAKAKHGGKMGPGWRAAFFHGPRHPNGLSLSLSDPDWDEVHKPLSRKTGTGDEYLQCSTRKRKENGKWRAADIAIHLGSTEITWTWPTLADVPESGYVDLLIDAPDLPLTWEKQLDLNEAEIAEGAERPENVVNSYAVFTPYSGRILTSAGEEVVNYQTGKICHVYRPCLVDAVGNRLWCDQSAPLGSPPRLRIWMPLPWLADATYPVTLDPTFGYTSVGASSGSTLTGYYLAGSQPAPASSGTVSSLSYYLTGQTNNNCTFGLYAGSVPGALLSGSATPGGTVNGTGWFSQNCTPSITAGTTYWFGLVCGVDTGLWNYDNSATYNLAYKTSGWTYSAGTMPNPFPSYSTVGRQFSCYATYIEAATGGAYRLLHGMLRGGQLAGGKLIGGR